MEPKRKSNSGVIIAVIIVVIAIYVSLKMAMAYDIVKEYPVLKNNKETFNIEMFFSEFGKDMNDNPYEIKWVDDSFKFVGASILVTIIFIAYYSSTRRNLITGKEYGTSRWGNPSELSNLRARNILKQEIKRVKKSKSKGE